MSEINDHSKGGALMGWSIGWDCKNKRDIGYGVPAYCDEPGCFEEIDRGLGYVCGNAPEGGDQGCGLHFCHKHLHMVGRDWVQKCSRCADGDDPFEPKADHPEWVRHKIADESWEQWRAENPDEVARLRAIVGES